MTEQVQSLARGLSVIRAFDADAPSQTLSDVARRVASRPAGERYTPVALCDGRGRLVGLVPVERILDRLATALDAAETS